MVDDGVMDDELLKNVDAMLGLVFVRNIVQEKRYIGCSWHFNCPMFDRV